MRSATFRILTLISNSKPAATIPPKTGEMNQLAAILDIVTQLTRPKPAPAMPAPITPPTIEWVVDTGAFKKVARLIHNAAANRALSIKLRKSVAVIPSSGLIIPLATV